MDEIHPQKLTLPAIDPTDFGRIADSVPGGAGNIQYAYPLAPLQDGMLYEILSGRSGYGPLCTVLELRSSTPTHALVSALYAVIKRHDNLRSAVFWEHFPMPYQAVCREAPISVERLVPGLDRDPVEQLLERTRTLVLDPLQTPVIQLQIAAAEDAACWHALLQVNRLMCDARSVDLVIAEVEAHLKGRTQKLLDPADHRRYVAEAVAYASRQDPTAYFRSRLGDVEEPTAPFGLLDVLADRNRVEEARLVLERPLARRLQTQAQKCSVSVAALIHASWGLVVSRTSGRDDVVYGSEVFSRLQPADAKHRCVGAFTNRLPLRLQLQGVTARELIAQAECELNELSKHEQSSWAVARRCSGLTGSAPLSGALLSFRERVLSPDTDAAGIAAIRVVAREGSLTYPIEVIATDSGEEISLAVKTDGRINPYRIAGYMHASAQSLVGALESKPETQAQALSILPVAERDQILKSFNATQAAYPCGKLIHELFEEQVERRPGTIALMHGERQLTYAELNSRANQLARYLRRKGIGPDELVGLCLERGIEMIVGLLAILKAGGAYVPLDPAYPAQRLSHMLEDAAPRIVLTQESLLTGLPETNAEVIALDAKSTEIFEGARQSLSPSELWMTSRHLVYVMYTSGSTGTPKAVAMPHQAIVNLIEWQRTNVGSCEAQRVLQFAPISFDVAFQEISSTLCGGGTLVLLEECVRKDHRELSEFLIDRSIHRLFIPPLVLQSLAEWFATSGTLPIDLRDVITAGEQLRITPEIRSLFKQLGECRLHNHYGPTETHVVTALTLPLNPDDWPDLPTIGRPISNTQIYVLDSHLELVPVGVAGEIYIGGAGVSLGYFKRPEITAQRFVLDPFSGDPDARLYRTGDLGRHRTDGVLEYLGRNDHQVKVRGYRIELGEIEARLALHTGVKDAAVIAREDVPGEKRLVAYVTPASALHGAGVAPSVDELRSHLAAVLPHFMVPSAFVLTDSLPLTPNGKLDRAALPPPGLGAYASAAYEAPKGQIETSLASMWSELLRVERVGREDNFFELGGHSVIGTKLIVKVAATFAIDVPFHAIFHHPTVREMADLVVTLQSERQQSLASSQQPEFEEGIV